MFGFREMRGDQCIFIEIVNIYDATVVMKWMIHVKVMHTSSKCGDINYNNTKWFLIVTLNILCNPQEWELVNNKLTMI